MNSKQEMTPNTLLDLATSRLREATVSEFPEKLISIAIENSSDNANHSRPAPRARAKITTAASFVAVAVAVAALIVIVMPSSAQVAFAQVLDNTRMAESLSFSIREGSGKRSQCIAAGAKYRVEHSSGIVIIGDSDAGKRLLLDPEKRAAGVFDLGEHAKMELGNGLVEQLRSVQPDEAEFVARESIDGKSVDVFLVKGIKLFGIDTSNGAMKVYVDRESALPRQIELLAGTTSIASLLEMTWNIQLDGSKLQLQVPDGYAEQSENYFNERLRAARKSSRKLTPNEAFRNWSGQSK